MTTTLTLANPQARISGFALAPAASARDAVLRASPEPSAPRPDVGGALSRRTDERLRIIDAGALNANRFFEKPTQNPWLLGTFVAGMTAAALGASIPLLDMFSPVSDSVYYAADALVMGGLAAASLYGAVGAVGFLGSRRKVKQLEGEVRTIQEVMQTSSALERAWIADRAEGTRAFLGPSLANSRFARQLGNLVAAASTATNEQRDEAQLLSEIHDWVFAMPSTREATNAGTTRGREIAYELEAIMDMIEQLSPEGRALIANQRDAVLAQLAKDPGNSWRIKRFIDVCDGKRTPYTSEVLEIADPLADPLALRLAPLEAIKIFTDVEEAVRSLLQRFLKDGRHARVTVASGAIAEKVAAYCESRGLRAALYQGDEGKVAVSAYEPGRPPRHGNVQLIDSGSRTRLRVSARTRLLAEEQG